MGGVLACVEELTKLGIAQMPDLQRLQYDLTPLKSKPVPVVWLVGPPGSGRKTQSQKLSENLGYENIRISELLRNESTKDTDRGKVIKECLQNPAKHVPDTVVVDLIKEVMLQKITTAKGFILNGFPRSSKQAALFVKEVCDVDVVVYLYSETHVMVMRTQEKNGGQGDPEIIRKNISNYVKEVREGVSKFGAKLEKIHTGGNPGDVYGRIEAAIGVRLKFKQGAQDSELKIAEQVQEI